MATMYTSSNPVETAPIRAASNPTTQHLTMPAPLDDPVSAVAGSSPQLSPRINLPPPPNPPFVFPPRPSSSSAPSSFSRATGRRPQSVVVDLQDRTWDLSADSSARPKRSPALPDFSFNPGATLSPDTSSRNPRSPTLPDFSFNPGAASGSESSLLSPPLSPHSPRAIPNPGRTGHRRGGSEFVGGKLKEGESIAWMSTSPTKSDSDVSSPTLAPARPRGRHAHRRSGAISSHDLSMILKPPSTPRGSSAPTSPADFDDRSHAFPEPQPEQGIESPKEEAHPQVPTEEKVEADEKPLAEVKSQPEEKPAARARVGFSDTLEFIPRPLSLVSTDTASTVTGRPGHSVSGSISSIISMTNSTIAEREPPGLLGSPVSSSKAASRPSTAGAVLERTASLHVLTESSPSPRRRNSIPLLTGLHQDENDGASSPTKTPKRWSFFGLESFASASSPTKSRPFSSGSSDNGLTSVDATIEPAQPETCPTPGDILTAPDDKKTPRKKKKQKKVKSWAGSILTRKSKSRSKAARHRSQTPPLRRSRKSDHGSPPASGHVDMMEPEHGGFPYASSDSGTPRQAPEDDSSFPMIDLDAALGPFNTPTSRDPQWEEAQRSGAPPKRQLHSAAGMRGFSGPGMHYHRRAESAPEMPPFEGGRFGIHRFGSSSTMADVFEEDEEDDDSEESGNDGRETSADESDGKSDGDDAASTPTQERDLSIISTHEGSQTASSIKRKGSGSSLDMQPPGSRMRTESSSNLHEKVIVEEALHHTPEHRPTTHDGSSAYETAAMPRRILSAQGLAPVEVNQAGLSVPPLGAASPYSMSHSSSFPSPRSAVSYDAQRISTAPSSVTDENNFHSLLMGEPGPEVVRISVDVPSLTSSNSTMTRESMFAPGVRPRNMPFHDQRPASFTSTAFGRRRSSLASLSRLISSAHGERSKLSVEVPCESEPEKMPKVSKSKRLSRMMQFWKPRETTRS
ncbi:hypothetical protein F4778DRAFT_228747 [Xylariomycetidae sp. FL2044]|nr:hypothetical protein F4778DRAFT_228747 [Xylariomycetidae sp. FL2044]